MSNQEVTSLILKSDSTQIRSAGRDLEKLSDSAKKVEQQTGKMERAMDGANDSLKDTSSQARKTTNELERLRKMMDGLRRFAGPLMAAATAVGVAGFTAYIKSVLDAADALAKLGRFLGVTIEQFQAWEYAASQSGVDARVLEASLRRLTLEIGKAAEGQNELSKMAEQLGVRLTDTQTAMYDIADAIANAESPTERARIAFAAFREEGTRMALMLANGSAGLRQFERQAMQMGMILSTETAEQVEAFNDKVDTLFREMTKPMKVAFLDEFTRGVEDLDMSLHPALLESLREFGERVGSVLAKLVNAAFIAANLAGELQEFGNRTRNALFGLPDDASLAQIDFEIRRLQDLIKEHKNLLDLYPENQRLLNAIQKNEQKLNDTFERRNQLLAKLPKVDPADVTVDRGILTATEEAEKLLHAYGDLSIAVEDFRRRIDPQRRKLQQMAVDHEMLAIAVHEGVISIQEYNDLIQQSAMLSHKPAEAMVGAFDFAIDRIEDAFEGMWRSLLDGSFDFGDAFRSLMQDIAGDIIRQNITAPLMAFMRGEEGASLQGVGANLGAMAGGALVGEAMGGGQATQGAMSGAMLGFQAGGPAGAVAGALLGGLLGRRSERKERRRQEQMAIQQEAERIQSMKLDLETQIAQMNGTYDLTKARERELSQLRDVNRSAAQRVHYLQDELERLQEIERIAQEREQLEDRLLQMQGNIVELRKKEMEAIDATNRPLLQMIHDMEDFAVAAQTMNAALAGAEAEVRQAYQAFVMHADRLERELYALIGGEAELAYQRRLVMDQLDPSLHAMQKQVWLLQDQRKAMQAATEAHDRYMASLDQAEDFLSGIFRSIDDFIFSMMAGETAAGARAVFQRTLAMARAGDQQALSGLVGSAQSFLTATRQEVGSELEFRRQQAAVARSLRGIKQLRPEELIAQEIRAGLLEQADTIREHMDDLLLLANVTIAEATATIQILQHGNLPQDIAQIADMVLREIVDVSVAIRQGDIDLPENYQRMILGTLGTLNNVVAFAVDPSNDLSKDDREIVLGTTSDLIKTINYITGSALSDEDKWIALQATDTLAKTIEFAVQNAAVLTEPVIQAVMAQTSQATKTLRILVDNADLLTPDVMEAATWTNESIQKTVRYTLDLTKAGDLTPEEAERIIGVMISAQEGLSIVIGSIDLPADIKRSFIDQIAMVDTTVRLSLAARADHDQKAYSVLVEGAAFVQANIMSIQASYLPVEQQKLLLDANHVLNRSIALSAVVASGANGLTVDQVTGLAASSAALNRSIAMAVSGGDFDKAQISALTQSAATLNRSVSASFTGTLSDWQQALIALTDGSSKVDLSIKGDNSYYNGIQDAVAGGVTGVDSNTKGIASDAQKQLSELGLLRNEMELNTNGVIRLNSSMTSLTSAIMRLAQLQEDALAEKARIEKEAADFAAAQAARKEAERINEILRLNIAGGTAKFSDVGTPTAVPLGSHTLTTTWLSIFRNIEDALNAAKAANIHKGFTIDGTPFTLSDAQIRQQLNLAYKDVLPAFNTYLQGLRDQIIALGGTPAFAEGGIHTGGMRIVGERGPELEMTGPSAIMSYNDLMQSLKSSGDVAAEIGSLRAEIRGLRQEARSTAVTNAEIARKINRIEREGLVVRPDPEEVEEAEVLAI